MASQSAVPDHIEATETLVRLYVFLAQYLDRCMDETARQSFPESELQAHLTTTRTRMMDILSVNRVVRDKVEKECDRVLSLGAACSKSENANTVVQKELKAERGILQNKIHALSDLLAVFRAM